MKKENGKKDIGTTELEQMKETRLLFADDTSVFNVVFETHISAEVLNQDLRAVQDWAHQ